MIEMLSCRSLGKLNPEEDNRVTVAQGPGTSVTVWPVFIINYFVKKTIEFLKGATSAYNHASTIIGKHRPTRFTAVMAAKYAVNIDTILPAYFHSIDQR